MLDVHNTVLALSHDTDSAYCDHAPMTPQGHKGYGNDTSGESLPGCLRNPYGKEGSKGRQPFPS